MTLKQKFENINLMYWGEDGCYEAVIAHEESYKCVKIADDYALGFAEWCRDIAVRETPYSTDFTNDWELRSEQKIVTTKELLEIYKKEKGL